jgi:hypothetical protein
MVPYQRAPVPGGRLRCRYVDFPPGLPARRIDSSEFRATLSMAGLEVRQTFRVLGCGLSAAPHSLMILGFQTTNVSPSRSWSSRRCSSTNLGLARMADASHGISYHHLVNVAQWHVSDDNYVAARAAVVNAHNKHPMAAIWDDGTTTGDRRKRHLRPQDWSRDGTALQCQRTDCVTDRFRSSDWIG